MQVGSKIYFTSSANTLLHSCIIWVGTCPPACTWWQQQRGCKQQSGKEKWILRIICTLGGDKVLLLIHIPLDSVWGYYQKICKPLFSWGSVCIKAVWTGSIYIAFGKLWSSFLKDFKSTLQLLFEKKKKKTQSWDWGLNKLLAAFSGLSTSCK